MDLSILAAELQKYEYSDLSDIEAALILNSKTIPNIISRFVNIRTMYAEIGPEMTETIVAKLTSAATDNVVIARVLSWISPSEGGIDMGNTVTRQQVTGLCASGLFSEAERDALLSMGEEKISIAESLGLGTPCDHDVARARELF